MFNFIFALIVALVSYLIYVYPIGVMFHLLFATDIHQPVLLLLSCILSGVVFIYFRTHNSSAILQVITYYGLGFGFLLPCLCCCFHSSCCVWVLLSLYVWHLTGLSFWGYLRCL